MHLQNEAIGERATPVVESRELGGRKDPVMLEAEIEQPDDRKRHEDRQRREGSAPGTHTQSNCGASPRENAVFGVRPPTVGNETSPLPSTRSLKRSDGAARRKLPRTAFIRGSRPSRELVDDVSHLPDRLLAASDCRDTRSPPPARSAAASSGSSDAAARPSPAARTPSGSSASAGLSA